MSSSDWLGISGYVIAPIGALILAVVAFTRTYRVATQWLRFGLICQVPLALAWWALGIYLDHHARSPEAGSPRMWALAQHKSFISGIAVGLLLLLALAQKLVIYGASDATSNPYVGCQGWRRVWWVIC